MSEAEALARALQENVSGLAVAGRGVGLYDVAELVTELGGLVCVRSGAAKREVSRELVRQHAVPHLPGTMVGAHIPCR